MELDEWDMTVLESLLNLKEIERDSFDFKDNESGLEKHVCAMANTITGVLCLGIKDPTSNSPTAVFRKDGFRIGTENERLNSIYNNVAKVDPIPRVTHRVLKDPDKKQFYVIIKVDGSVSDRPYMIKDRGQIFVRIGSSTNPASRATIANLFINLLERRHNILKLQSRFPYST
jgi:predicted HTH transcriptional regulator